MTKTETGQSAEWWRGATIYQIYPRSFMDSNGDGIGDLAGITSRLDHVASLGVDAIWLSPFFKSPMRDFGYDVADYCEVDPIFGSMEDFDRLIERAHALGLKVIIDQVFSHTSDEHSWFAESRKDRTNQKADWYVWADARKDGTPPNNWQSYFGGPAWHWDGFRKQYYLHNFLTSQPDLNLHNKDVQNALLETARFWLDRGVDGFRLDVVNCFMHDTRLRNNPPSGLPIEKVTRSFDMQLHTRSEGHPKTIQFLKRLRGVLDEYEGDRFTVAEVAGSDPLEKQKAYTLGNKHLSTAYAFDFLYLPKLSIDAIKAALSGWKGERGEGWPSWAFSNHDAPRAVSRWSRQEPSDAHAKLYLLLLLSLRGNVFVYQGEELGLPQGVVPFERLQDPEAIENWPNTLGRDGARTPIPWQADAPQAGFSSVEPWLPVDEDQKAKALDTQEGKALSVLTFFRAAQAVRKTTEALRLGQQSALETSGETFWFAREYEGNSIICLFNIGEKAASPPAGLPAGARLIHSTHGADHGMPETLPPLSGFWLHAD